MGELRWATHFDVVVAGFGLAGACAALEAARAGARVLVVERFDGGGSSRLSGGQIYAGGGTPQQRAAGFEDSPEAMAAYLRAETGDAVPADVLDAFCRSSAENLAWLEDLGVPVPATFSAAKLTQPPAGIGLAFSGNEKQRSGPLPPVARSHHADGPGLTGFVVFDTVAEAVEAHPLVTVVRHARVVGLRRDPDGAVDGVDLAVIPKRQVRGHRWRFRVHRWAAMARAPFAEGARHALERFEGRVARNRAVQAGAVVLATGGFAHNAELVHELAPRYAGTTPLGTPGDDGAAMALTRGLGAAVRSADRCAASRFLYPPVAFVGGVIVGPDGRRLCDESLYGSTVSDAIARAGGRAWLVIDSSVRTAARHELRTDPERLRDHRIRDVLDGHLHHVLYRRAATRLNLTLNRRAAPDLARLARRIGVPPAALEDTVRSYNDAAVDAFGKPAEFRRRLEAAPFLAIDVRLHSRIFPVTNFTLGGLATDVHARVLRHDGSVVDRLYAAGRAAAGLCAGGYVSGLSLADCVFSGRAAGRHAAGLSASAPRSVAARAGEAVAVGES